MKFKLIEDFDSGLENGSAMGVLDEDVLNEGYEILWKQFEQVSGISKNNYHLHHIYNDNSSKNGANINFFITTSNTA